MGTCEDKKVAEMVADKKNSKFRLPQIRNKVAER